MKQTSTRVISVFIAVLMIFSSLTFTSAAAEKQMDVKVSAISGCPGDTVNITVTLGNNPGISSLLLDINYDDEIVKLTSVVFAAGYGDMLEAPEPYKNPQKLSFVSLSQEIETNGLFATLSFEILKNAGDAVTAPITVTHDRENVFDGDNKNVSLNITDGFMLCGKQTHIR